MLRNNIIGVIALAAVLYGCGKTEYSTGSPIQIPMHFSSYAAKSSAPQAELDDWNELESSNAGVPASRANDSFVPANSAIFPDGSSFGVYSWFEGTSTPRYFINQEVNCSVEEGVATYSYSPLRYWPQTEMDFWAYYPYGDSNLSHIDGEGNAFGSSSEGLGQIDFTVPADAANQTDLMLADEQYGLTYDNTLNGTVPFTFHHMLTQIQFKAVNEFGGSNTIALTEVTLLDVSSHARLSISGNAKSSSWGNYDTDIDYSIVSTSTPVGAEELLLTPTPLLLIPQDITSMKLRICYSIRTAGKTIEMTPEEYDVKTTQVPSWQAGKSIVYKLNLGASLITVTPELVDWRNATGSSITVE